MTAIREGDRIVVNVRHRPVGGCEHVSAVVLNDDTIVAASEAVRQIREYGKRYRVAGGAIMGPGRCPGCGETVLT